MLKFFDLKYFGFEKYRTLVNGRPLQKQIIDSCLGGTSLLGILPTGGGKSICYQIPALHRYHRLGELTIVISPLKALMKDQVDNLFEGENIWTNQIELILESWCLINNDMEISIARAKDFALETLYVQ